MDDVINPVNILINLVVQPYEPNGVGLYEELERSLSTRWWAKGAGKKGTNESTAVCISSRVHGYVVYGTRCEVEDCKPDLEQSWEVKLYISSPIETYEGALVFTIKVREELVEARLRDQVVFRERKALRVKCSGLNTRQGGSISRSCSFTVDEDSQCHPQASMSHPLPNG